MALIVCIAGVAQGHAAAPPGRTLIGQTPDVVVHSKAKLRGHHKSDDVITLNIGQSVRNPAALDAFIATVTDRHNAMYGHYLTDAQYVAQYAPTDQDTQSVRDWATSTGLTVTDTGPDNLLVTVQGTTTKIEQALGVTINDYQRDDGSTFRSNDRDATIPADLDIRAVSGLSTYAQAQVAPTAFTVASGSSGYYPNDYRTAYDMDLVGPASNQNIGLTLWGAPVAQSDLNTFSTQSGTPRLVSGQSGNDGIDWYSANGNPLTDTNTITQQAEVALDVEYAHGVAPGSHLRYWLGPCDYSNSAKPGDCSHGQTVGIEKALYYAATSRDVHIVSNSWSLSNITSASDPIVSNIEPSLQRGVAGGTTFYFATGDFGRNSGCLDPTKPAHPCPPAYPAASRYAVAVGGTSLDTNSDHSYSAEAVWDDPGSSNESGGASGGGCATYEARPSWQSEVTISATNDGNACTGRAIPDVAAAAGGHNPAYIVVKGALYTDVGTSLATPLWAGMTAGINNTLGHGGFFLAGFIGPSLYQFAPDTNFDPSLFHDVTVKEAGPSYAYGAAYPAGTGWDEATGLGSVSASTLLSYLQVYAYPAQVYTFAGTGQVFCPASNVQALAENFNTPVDVATDRLGRTYITDSTCNRVVMVDSTGVVSVTVGTGFAGYTGDGGAATQATLHYPNGIAVDSNLNVYIADTSNNVIRKVSSNGTISTFAGTGVQGYNGTGMAATSTQLDQPFGVAVDYSNNVYIADAGNDVIRKVDSTGKMTIVAGVPGNAAYNGDNITATSAYLNGPTGVAADSQGNVFIADQDNNRIREVTSSDGQIRTIAGTGVQGHTGDGGPATSGQISSPSSLTLDTFDTVYFTERDTNYVRQVVPDTGDLFTIAGTGVCGSLGDGGSASNAQFCTPLGIALDKGQSHLYIADSQNSKVRQLAVTQPAQ